MMRAILSPTELWRSLSLSLFILCGYFFLAAMTQRAQNLSYFLLSAKWINGTALFLTSMLSPAFNGLPNLLYNKGYDLDYLIPKRHLSCPSCRIIFNG